MENWKRVATALNNIVALNIAGSISKDQWEKVVMDYYLHMVSVNWSDLTISPYHAREANDMLRTTFSQSSCS